MSDLADSKNEDNNMSNFGVLRERVAGVDRRLVEIVERLDKLTDAVHDGSKTKWPELIGFATVISFVLGALWLLVIVPLQDGLKATVSVKEEGMREAYVDKQILQLENGLKEKANKDDVNQKLFELVQRSKK